ncbi:MULTISPECIES: chaperone modulator CbpM [Alteromonadaceae]|uniref:chaperone modulator CbpM n=1 Tax=Alteromonadaceae TaxID=72275 RepID=UPI001C08BAC7|nr:MULTISPECIES: chaperone modulator CbpM [Aliiglaciecola]MBU2876320.1 chaperone modulatory protein CbpM [Aliiglaciecola lipolytica]MDO6710536.1 chaperone modulator CbpM [Aliiglaciecola sp. 2_MG-2023]MDO6751599.1 chaperone modulator CbpM [Aliiglaciecola sp. 1_MG-2023]
MSEITLHLSIHELCEYDEITQDSIYAVVEYGIAIPIEGNTISEWIFDLDSAHWIKKAVRLNQQFQIDWVATAMVIELMRQKEQLERENDQLKTRIERLL